MSVFEETLLLSSEDWMNSLEANLSKHKFSKKHNRIMKELIYGKKERKRIKLSKGTIKALIIAAVLLAIATTAFALPASREFIIKQFFNHSSYNIVDTDHHDDVDLLIVNYIPTNFNKSDEFKSKSLYSLTYENGTYYFSVDKHSINTQITFDTEKYEHENIYINGNEGIYYKTNNSENGLIFNNSYYIYLITGNINKEEIVKIAQNIE